MMLEVLTAALLQLGQPQPCLHENLQVFVGHEQPGFRERGWVLERGGVVDVTVRVINQGPVDYPRAALALRIETMDQAARLDDMTVDISTGPNSWRRLERSAGLPTHTFGAPIAELSLAAGQSQDFAFRMRLPPALSGVVRSVGEVTGIGCLERGFVEQLVAGKEPPAATASWWSLPAGIGAGALLALVVQGFRRHPARLARRARS